MLNLVSPKELILDRYLFYLSMMSAKYSNVGGHRKVAKVRKPELCVIWFSVAPEGPFREEAEVLR